MADESVIDWQQAAELVGGNAEVAKEMLAELHASLPNHLASLDEALSAKDYGVLYDQVHRLYGGLCYCGVPQLRSAVLALKQACLDNRQAAIEVSYHRVLQARQAFDEVMRVSI